MTIGRIPATTTLQGDSATSSIAQHYQHCYQHYHRQNHWKNIVSTFFWEIDNLCTWLKAPSSIAQHYQNCYEHRHWKSIVFTFFSEDCSEVQNQEKIYCTWHMVRTRRSQLVSPPPTLRSSTPHCCRKGVSPTIVYIEKPQFLHPFCL